MMVCMMYNYVTCVCVYNACLSLYSLANNTSTKDSNALFSANSIPDRCPEKIIPRFGNSQMLPVVHKNRKRKIFKNYKRRYITIGFCMTAWMRMAGHVHLLRRVNTSSHLVHHWHSPFSLTLFSCQWTELNESSVNSVDSSPFWHEAIWSQHGFIWTPVLFFLEKKL